MNADNIIELINHNYIIETSEKDYEINIENIISTEYQYMINKPQINSTELVGNLSSEDLGLASIEDIKTKENLGNKISSIDEYSSDLQYPSAKCVFNELSTKLDNNLANLSAEGLSKFDTKADRATTLDGYGIIDGANITLNNLDEQGEKHFLNKSQITNCILEVPQRINAEPSDVYLMLKAGSIVSVSTNGTFEDVIIEENVYLGSNLLTTPEGTRDLFACYVPSLNEIRNIPCDAMHCQATAPESNDANLLIGLYGGWLDTSTNTMKFTYDGGVTWEICSLPFALGHPSGTTWIGKVKQIFNGFGFAGKSIWVDKGVKYLVAKGRNDDGSLKNYEVEIPELRLTTFTNTLNKYAILNFAGSVIGGTADFITSSKQPTVSNTSLWYNPDTNITSIVLADGTVNTPYNEMACGTLEYLSTGRIKSFTPYQPFHAVDYSEYIKTPRIIETYANGTSWYRVYSDCWCEQGGTTARSQLGAITVTFLKPFANTNYTLITTHTNLENAPANSGANNTDVVGSCTTTGCAIMRDTNYATNWVAKGYVL